MGDQWRITVEPAGRVWLADGKISNKELKDYAVAWAKDGGTWPIVVFRGKGATLAQVTSIVTMLRKAGVKTQISCVNNPRSN